MAYQSWSVVFGEQPSAAKWNILGTNDASFNDGTGIGNGAISSPQKLVTGAGTSWAWQSYTPTFTNLTVGNGTLNSTYVQTGKDVTVRGSLVLGSTSSVGSNPYFTLPATQSSNYSVATDNFTPVGGVSYRDVSAGIVYPGYISIGNISGTGNALFLYIVSQAAASAASMTALSSTTPYTWATGDVLKWQFEYEVT